MIRRALLTQNLAHGQAGASEQLRQQQPRRRAFEIFDDVRLDPGIADHREHVARRSACRVVVDDDVHHATSGRRRRRALQLPDLAQLRVQRHLVEAPDRQA